MYGYPRLPPPLPSRTSSRASERQLAITLISRVKITCAYVINTHAYVINTHTHTHTPQRLAVTSIKASEKRNLLASRKTETMPKVLDLCTNAPFDERRILIVRNDGRYDGSRCIVRLVICRHVHRSNRFFDRATTRRQREREFLLVASFESHRDRRATSTVFSFRCRVVSREQTRDTR